MNQRFVPMRSYEDGLAAMDWLVGVFGFSRGVTMTDEAGRLTHGELELDGQRVMVASASPEYRNPNHMRAEYDAAGKWLELPYIFDGMLVYVDNLDATFGRVVAAGAEILSPIEDGFPGRRFRMADLEGHRWFVFQAVDLESAMD
jgi:PhnB protein